jgi:hypothetical protein
MPTVRPTSRPAITAPQKLPTPPRTMIKNDGMTASTPTCGRSPQMGVRMIPAAAARAAPSPNTNSRRRPMLMPSARTISLSWAPAFTLAPYGVFSRKSHTRPIKTMPTNAAKKRYFE